MHSQSQVSAISWPSFLLEFGDYHIGQVIESAPYIASWSDVLKCIEIWRVNHAIEIWKILNKIFPELQDEQLSEIPDVATDIDGDEDEDDNDWMRMLNDSFNDFSFTAMLEEEASMDVDASYEAAIPDILDNFLSSIWSWMYFLYNSYCPLYILWLTVVNYDIILYERGMILRPSLQEDQAGVIHAISPIWIKLCQIKGTTKQL